MPSTHHEGGCHCGNLTLTFELTKPLDQVVLRRCECGFCARHGALVTGDPSGLIRLTVKDQADLNTYSFGKRSLDFWLCRRCGVYVLAVHTEGPQRWALVNVLALEEETLLASPVQPIVIDDSLTFEVKSERRRKNWTPLEVARPE
jgi:hypothetical protein